MVKNIAKKTNQVSGEQELPNINIGIVGHIDHGKTTLLYKLSGKWTDTHSEELKRGITLKLGYADITLFKNKEGYNRKEGEAVRHVSFVDAPGHEMLMATMLSGAAIIDAAILVVAANEGIKPQTREHLMALQAKKVSSLIVVQNKIDLVEREQALESYKEIKQLLKGKYNDAPIIPVSAQQEVNLDTVYKAIAELPIPERDMKGEPLFVVARSFDINKPGTVPENLHGAVLGGTLKRGILKVGDNIEIKPGRVIKEANQLYYRTLKTKAVRLFRGSSEVHELMPGGSMSVETQLDMVLGKNDALAGCVFSRPGILPEITQSIKITYRLFPESSGVQGLVRVEPLKVSEMIMLSVNTAFSVGIVKRLQKDSAEISLKIPIVPCAGESIGIARNFNNHWRLIGYGEIL